MQRLLSRCYCFKNFILFFLMLKYILMTRIINISVWLVIFVSIAVMAGWFLDINILKSIVPGFVTMKFTTALSFFASGFLLYSINRTFKHKNSYFSTIIIPIVSMVILILMGTLIASVIFSFKSGLENIFVTETPDAILSAAPGLPSIGTMINFLLIGITGLFFIGYSLFQSRILYFSGYIITAVSLVSALGYILSKPYLYYTIPEISSGMAIHTTILFLIIGLNFVLLGKLKNKS
jgi:hypothetical protein